MDVDVVISPNNMSSTYSDISFQKSDDIKEYSKIKDSKQKCRNLS